MSMEDLEKAVREIQDRAAIHDCVIRYCRAVDRLDRELLLSCYHPDAVDDHGIFLGSPEEFADWVLPLHTKAQTVTQHIVNNHSCDLDGDVAHTETYYTFAGMNRAGTPLTVCGGRYLDRFEKRDGIWAIALRISLLEWYGTPGEIFVSREKVDANDHSHGGSRDRTDPSYERPMTLKSKHAAYRIVA